MMQPVTFTVSTALGAEQPLFQVAWVFLPPPDTAPKAALVCLPGGTYDKRYWHMEIDGHAGYSFAEHLADQGFIVVAVDHLGVGESSDPDETVILDLPRLADGDAEVARQIRARLEDGDLVHGLAPIDLPLIGVGHSMGACLTAMVQARAKPYDAVALLGYGAQVPTSNSRTVEGSTLESRIADSAARLREAAGHAENARWTMVPRARLRAHFHSPDVPDDVVAADNAAESRAPLPACHEVTAPGYAEPYMAEIDVPVFLGFGGGVDSTSDGHAEPGYYRACTDVTLYLLPGAAHCHNFASNREVLWDRLGAWATSQLSGHAEAPAGDGSVRTTLTEKRSWA
ncbi:alpha/beta hydrolase [Pseudonocardia kunmingensis]|uniref:Alpha-beta hydrolase superfamily lysophospholipase n=1 Tax=Pseudonocardia kunmingensis TaxID=630975 RepID=A0A543DPM8_9PSEU|nr:alpha/beta fold hydrolase [Pseudonocardia kunmingensis]TQM11265.1 alpha-beta hydrolase superfamily lysophospholipase [Pseudonocardia kunmingensis]